jgi:hypothetical protein
MCFEIAGWLMRSSAAAAENDLCRANAANARNRASSFITPVYTNAPFMYFFLEQATTIVGVSARQNGEDNA